MFPMPHSDGQACDLLQKISDRAAHGLKRRRVLIADDHALLAEGVARLLATEYEVLGTVHNGRRLVLEAARLQPDLVVLDISMPELNGIEAAAELQTLAPHSRIVFVTQQADPQYLRAAFRAGAMGYVIKQSASEDLLLALRQAQAGKTYISPQVHAAVGYAPASELRAHPERVQPPLTTRQRQVLQLVAEGKTTRQISESLNISPKTVEFHKNALMNETGVRTTAELTRYALAHNIISH